MSGPDLSRTNPGPKSATDDRLQRTVNETRPELESESDENENSTKDSKEKDMGEYEIDPTKQSKNSDHPQQEVHEAGDNRSEHESDLVEKEPIGKDSKGKEMKNTKSEMVPIKQSRKEKGDCLQETDNLKTLQKKLSDKDEELSETKPELQSTKNELSDTQYNLWIQNKDLEETKANVEQLTKQLHDTEHERQSSKTRTENLKTLTKNLRAKDEDLKKKNTELQSTKQTLTETKSRLGTMEGDLQETKTKLDHLTKQLQDTNSDLQSTQRSLKGKTDKLETLTKQLSDKDEEHRKAKEHLNGTVNILKATTKNLQETKKKLEELTDQYLEQGRVMAECCSKWDMEGKKREQAEKEAKELRSANERANGGLQELWRQKVSLLWRLAFRLVYERQLKTKLRDMICARTEGLRTQLNTMFRKHMEEQNRLQALIDRQNEEQEAAKEEWQTQEATLRDSIEELDVKKSELEDQVTHCQLQVKEREGSVEIAKVWVQKLSQQCGANDMIQEELDKTKTALARKDTLYQDTLEQLQGAQRDAVQLQVNLDREKQLTAAMGNAALQRATDVRHDHQRIVVIKEENEKLERALRDAHRCNEEQCEELMKNKLERKKLVAELLSLRRQLTNMTENKDRLQVKCNHLEYELSQSPLNSTPNNTNTRHDQDPDTSLDPALYGLDQLSPVHHSPDVWSRQDAGSWSNMDESFNN